MEIFLLWIILSLVVGYVGDKRKIGFFASFLISLLLSPVIGLKIALASKDKDHEIQQQAFNQLLRGMQQQKQPIVPTTPSTPYEEDIRALKKLKDEGIITEDEFTEKKRKLLGI